jgi:hypothetical protein
MPEANHLDPEVEGGHHDPRILGALTIEGAEDRQMIRELTIAEADPEIISTLIDRPEGMILLGCGDDRPNAPASSESLQQRPYLRYFGGSYGLSRVTLVTLAAQYGPRALREYAPNDFLEFSSQLSASSTKKADVMPIAHSAVSNELDEANINPYADTPLGCAYAFNIGEVSHIAGYNEDIQRLSSQEFESLFGNRDDYLMERVAGYILTG